MTEPQARRYLTRAHAKKEDSAVENKLPYQWKASIDTNVSRVTRATKRAVSSRATEKVPSAQVAPKRKTAKNGAVAKKASTTAPSKPVKKVTFNDDKENFIPATPRLEELPAERERNADGTDDLMSSMGALSVKPLRVPATKLRLPTTNMNVSSAFDPLPALSPSKARRILPPRVGDDADMEDELSRPAPKLAAKPIRPISLSSPVRGLEQPAKKPLDLSASLTSPARRPPASPFKLKTVNTPLSKPNGGAPRPEITSPARRPPASATAAMGNPSNGALKLGSALTLKIEIPDLSKPGIRGPAKRPKAPVIFRADESEDELGMNMENYTLGNSPTRVPKKRGQVHRTPDDIAAQKGTILGRGEPSTVKAEAKEVARSTILPRKIGAPFHGEIFDESPENQNLDAEGDTHMEDVDEFELLGQIFQSPTKYKTPVQDGNGFGFFNLEDDSEDEISPVPFTGNPFTKINLQPLKRKTLFRSPPDSKPRRPGVPAGGKPDASIPIDPFLLTLSAPTNTERYESPSRTVMVPVKMHSIDDAVSSEDEDENENENGENAISQALPQCSSRSNVIRPAGVLAGAVVFVDVRTAKGADASAAFAESLRGLGAKVLKNWNWNPNPNGAPADGESKIGITHVVFKDGSPRTLQKVKESKGVVLCVGVAWVTACENVQSWVEESIYPVDLDHIPRGGHRRRKSMEPKALSMVPGGCALEGINSLTLKSPQALPRKVLFPHTVLSHRTVDERNPVLMQNLLLARRKSMQFAPKIGSPLRRFTPISMD